jgi:hypothetical protein
MTNFHIGLALVHPAMCNHLKRVGRGKTHRTLLQPLRLARIDSGRQILTHVVALLARRRQRHIRVFVAAARTERTRLVQGCAVWALHHHVFGLGLFLLGFGLLGTVVEFERAGLEEVVHVVPKPLAVAGMIQYDALGFSGFSAEAKTAP